MQIVKSKCKIVLRTYKAICGKNFSSFRHAMHRDF